VKYRRFLGNELHHLIDDVPLDIIDRIWHLHDDAPALFSLRIRRRLKRSFPAKMDWWRCENPYVSHELERDSPKVNVWCTVNRYNLYGPLIFAEETVRSGPHLDILKNFFESQLQQEKDIGVAFRQDSAPPHCVTDVRDYLDDIFSNNRYGRGGPLMWPPNSPDLIPTDYFLWGFVKDDVQDMHGDPRIFMISEQRFYQFLIIKNSRVSVSHWNSNEFSCTPIINFILFNVFPNG
ncbi:hypothetical protein ANN_02744, partial [Periplaneta americana]